MATPMTAETTITRSGLSNAVKLSITAGVIGLALAAAGYQVAKAPLKNRLAVAVEQCAVSKNSRSVICTVALQNKAKKDIKSVKLHLYTGNPAKRVSAKNRLTTTPVKVKRIPAKQTVKQRVSFSKPASWSFGQQQVFAQATVGAGSLKSGQYTFNVNTEIVNAPEKKFGTLPSDVPAAAYPQTDGTVRAMIAASDGTLYIGGEFKNVGGIARKGTAHILSDGTVDPNWNPGGDDIRTLALAGSTIYIGGHFTTVGGQTRKNLAAVDAKSGAVTSWNPSPDDTVFALVATNSTVYIAGAFLTVGGQSQKYLAAVDTGAGSLKTWNPAPNASVRTLAASASTLYAGGEFTSVGGKTHSRLAAFALADGSLSDTWKPSLSYAKYNAAPTYPLTMVVQQEEVVYVGGYFDTVNGSVARSHLAAFDAQSGNALDWNPGPSNLIAEAIAIVGTTVYVGSVPVGSAAADYRLAAYDVATGARQPWNPDPKVEVTSLAAAGNTLYAGGGFSLLRGQSRAGLAKFDVGSRSPRTMTFPYDAAAELDVWNLSASQGGTPKVSSGIVRVPDGTAMFYDSTGFPDVELQTDVSQNGTASRPEVVVRHANLSNYYCNVSATTDAYGKTTDALALGKMVNQSRQQQPVSAGWEKVEAGKTAMQNAAWYTMKIRAEKDSVKCKMWLKGTTEPDWLVSVSDAEFTDGVVGMSSLGTGSASVQYDNTVVTPLNASNVVTNRLPIIYPVPQQVVAVGQKLEFTVTMTDPDGVITDIGQGTPIGMLYNALDIGKQTATARFTWTPTADQIGVQNLLVKAYDDLNDQTRYSSLTIPITVIQPGTAAIYRFDDVSELSDWDAYDAWEVKNGILTQTGYGKRYLEYQKNTQYRDVSVQTDFLAVNDIPGIVTRSGGYDCVLAPTFIAIYKDSHGEGIGTKPQNPTLGSWYTMKFQARGDTLSCKVWERGAAEPSAWTLAAKNDEYTQEGGVGLREELPEPVKQYDNVIIRPLKTNIGNRYPAFVPFMNVMVTAGQPHTLNVAATDADGDALFLRAHESNMEGNALPTGASFVDNGNGTGILTWTPTTSQVGAYSFEITADDGQAKTSRSLLVTVTDANTNRPILYPVQNQVARVGATTSFTFTAVDPNDKPIALTYDILPPGASFVDNGNGTGTFTWTPTEKKFSIYNVTFTASNGTDTATQQVVFTWE